MGRDDPPHLILLLFLRELVLGLGEPGDPDDRPEGSSGVLSSLRELTALEFTSERKGLGGESQPHLLVILTHPFDVRGDLIAPVK